MGLFQKMFGTRSEREIKKIKPLVEKTLALEAEYAALSSEELKAKTPWFKERLANGDKQKQLSKEFVREWLMANGFQGQEGQQVPEMTPEIVNGITERYVELYENIVGEKFEKAENADVLARIEKNVTDCLSSL